MTDGTAGLAPELSEKTIHVVVSCTDRKTRAPVQTLYAQQLPTDALSSRVAAWIDALRTETLERIPAEQLYAGDHWQVVRSLRDSVPSGLQIRTWVCSAGFGLINLETLVCAYAATFSLDHADAIAP